MFRIRHWLRALSGRATPARRSSTFKPVLERLEDRRLPTTTIQLGNVVSINSFAGVGFQENVACNYLAVSVNGQPDFNKSDFQAQIDWGDGGTSTGDLVNTGSDATSAFYIIKGTHIYADTGTNIPINVTVTGPGGASDKALTAYADVAPMPSGIPGTAPSSFSSAAPENVVVELGNIVAVDSFTGVGFQENVAANYLAVSVNGQPDLNPGDLHAQINWGDSADWTSGDLVYLNSDATSAFYEIKGSHVYTQSTSSVPIVVYVNGPDGTSTSAHTADADVTPMPSGIPGTPPPAGNAGMPPSDVRMQLGNIVAVNAFAGVAFQDQVVANYLAISVNGEPDQSPGDLHAEINWGDNADWTTGKLIYVNSDATSAFYEITGSYTYQKPKQQIPIVVYVTGPDGTSVSAQTADASVAPNPNPVLGDLSPASWDENEPGYQGTIDVTGGSNGYQNLQITGLPAGLTYALETASGSVNGSSAQSGTITISGTPTENGTFPFTVSLQDGNGGSVQGNYTLTIAPALTLGSLTPAQWTIDQPNYNGTIDVNGGAGGYQLMQVSGLPDGLSASVDSTSGTVNGNSVQSGTITISGTPTEAGVFPISLTVQDGNGGQVTGDYTLTIQATSTITLGALVPDQWNLNQAGYQGTIAISGGTGNYVEQVAGLPNGLTDSMAGNNIVISGTPEESGTFDLSISVQDDAGNQASGTDVLTIQTVTSPMQLGALSPSAWNVNQPGYDGTISVSGGMNGYPTFQVAGLPKGLNADLQGAAGSVNGTTVQNGTIEITGTPVQTGTFSLEVSVQDGNGDVASGTYSLTIQAAASPIILGTLTPNRWTLGQPGYDGTISISGGNGTYSEQLTGLPGGLTDSLLNGSIQISGTPTQTGIFTLNVAVQDTAGNQISGTDTLTINSAVMLGNLTPTQWTVNQPGYDGTIGVSGGSGSYGSLQVSGLPAGLNAALSGSTISITGTPSQSGTFANIQVSVQDTNNTTGTGTYTLTIDSSSLTLGSLDPTAWTVNQPGYAGTISISGGNGKYQDLQVTGLPSGLAASLAGNLIKISGTPTQQGVFSNIQVSVQDSAADHGTGSYNLTINPNVRLGPLDPTQWTVNEPGYDGIIPVSGGTDGYKNLQIKGLPTGLTYALTSTSVVLNGRTLQSGDITITGTPTKAGNFTLTISLQDGTGSVAVDAVAAVAHRAARTVTPEQQGPNQLPQRSLTITPTTVDLTPSIGTIVPTSANNLALTFFFGTEAVSVPVTIQNLGPNNANGQVNLSLALSTNPNGTGAVIGLPITLPNKLTVTQDPVQLNNLSPGSNGQQVTCNVTIPKTAVVGTKYYVVATLALPQGSAMTDSNPNNNTGHSIGTFEFVGTPTTYVAPTKTKAGHGAVPFFWSNPATRPKGYAGYHSYFQMIQDTLNGPSSYVPAANVTVPPHPTASQANTITEAFIAFGEGTGLGPYNDSAGIATIGIGMNLTTLATNVRQQLAADVLANCTASTGFTDLAQMYQDNSADFVLPKAKGGGVNVQGILTLLQTPQSSGGLLKTSKTEAQIPVLTSAQEWSLFRLLLNKYVTNAMNGYTAAGGDWSALTARQQALLVDLNFNVGSNYNQMDRDLAAGDLRRAAFDLVNAFRTTQGPNSRGLNTRTEADLQMMFYSQTGPSPLGQVITPPGH